MRNRKKALRRLVLCAALVGCAVVTGVGAVVNTARVPAGTSVAVFGMGGVGLSAVMGARAVGAYPIVAVDRLDDKLRLAREVGATHVINAAQDDAVEECAGALRIVERHRL